MTHKLFHGLSALALGALLILVGCSGAGPDSTGTLPRPEPGGTTQPAAQPAAQPATQPAAQPTPQPATQPVSLTPLLDRHPAPAAAPTFRWQRPSASMGFMPLPSGVLLIYNQYLPRTVKSQPFAVMAVTPDKKELWVNDISVTNDQIESLDFSPDGERVAVVRRDGMVIVLETRTGATVGVVKLPTRPGSVALIDNGKALAATTQTQSGIYRWQVDVFPVTVAPNVTAKPAYGTEGSEVFTSPHHGLLLAVTPEGVAVVGPGGPLGVVPGALPQRGVKLHISGDGQWIFVWGADTGKLYIYDRNLKPLGEPIAMAQAELDFPSFAPVYYQGRSMVAPGQKPQRLEYDTTRWHIRNLLPGGEALMVPTTQEQIQCVATPNGQLFGCLPWISWYRDGNRTFLWHADEQWINAYRL